MNKINPVSCMLSYGLPVFSWLVSLAAAAVGWLQMERSAGQENHVLLALPPQYLMLGILTVLSVHLVIYAFCGRRHIATAVGGLIVTVYSLVNYYVKMLHGTAIMALDIANIATAADVAGSYSISPDPTSIKIALCYLPVLAAAVIQWLLFRCQQKSAPAPLGRRRHLIRGGCCALLLFVLYFFGYFGPWSLMPRDVATLANAVAFDLQSYGYTPLLVSSARLLLDPVVKPEGYDEADLQTIAARGEDYVRAVPEVSPGEYPDIVLILNESFYDLSLVTDPQPDSPYLEFYSSLGDNATLGYALVPDVGGGTNRSEFSLLTSHSLSLLPGITPFSCMSMEGQFSIVSYLETLGYHTLAGHPAVASNYRRGIAWPELGFDQTAFEEDFTPFTPYGDRIYYVTDSEAYARFTQLYEAMPADSPRFAYLLTIQNHGGYDSNSEDTMLVHAGTDYGDYDHGVDEYLSCISLSDDALAELTGYFTDLYETSGRKVVLLMVGDHAPYMAAELTDAAVAGSDPTIRQRATPFLLWTNYPTEARVETGSAETALPVADLCALMPMAVEQAGLPLSPYYQYILAMRQTYPAWNNLNGILAADGTLVETGSDPRAGEWLSGYYALEYNALILSEQISSLFLPAAN